MAMTARASNIGGMMVAETRNGNRSYHAHDSQGNTVALISDEGKVTDSFDYWPYGEVRVTAGSASSTPFKFGGAWGYYDDGNQLYIRARYLREKLGRWLTRDPLWPSESAYGFAAGNPLTRVDRSGTSPESSFIALYCQGPGIECCTPDPPCCDPFACGLPPYVEKKKKYCAECAKNEGFKSVPELCDKLGAFDKRKPQFPSPSDLLCARSVRVGCFNWAVNICPPPSHPLFDKCRHCMASCCIANKCGRTVAEYIGWCRERSQLLDCIKGGFGDDDQDANLIGIRGAPRCRSACKQFGL